MIMIELSLGLSHIFQNISPNFHKFDYKTQYGNFSWAQTLAISTLEHRTVREFSPVHKVCSLRTVPFCEVSLE